MESATSDALEAHLREITERDARIMEQIERRKRAREEEALKQWEAEQKEWEDEALRTYRSFENRTYTVYDLSSKEKGEQHFSTELNDWELYAGEWTTKGKPQQMTWGTWTPSFSTYKLRLGYRGHYGILATSSIHADLDDLVMMLRPLDGRIKVSGLGISIPIELIQDLQKFPDVKRRAEEVTQERRARIEERRRDRARAEQRKKELEHEEHGGFWKKLMKVAWYELIGKKKPWEV